MTLTLGGTTSANRDGPTMSNMGANMVHQLYQSCGPMDIVGPMKRLGAYFAQWATQKLNELSAFIGTNLFSLLRVGLSSIENLELHVT